MKIAPVSDYVSEIGLLAWLGSGVIAVLVIASFRGNISGDGALDVAAFLLVLQRIVEAVQKRWEQRSMDRMGASLANAPPAEPAAKAPGDAT